MADEDLLVVCLCADWCGTCRDYQPGFKGLAADFPQVRFRWVDIEEDADLMGDLDIENFPTLLIRRGNSIVFFGTMLPYLEHLRRTIETFQEQTLEQSQAYAQSNDERLAWQRNPDLRSLSELPGHG
jgi:thioredoxin 1